MAGQLLDTDAARTDRELILEFRDRRSEQAFGELVRRHVNLVFGTAMRSVRNRPLAEEISQNVFIALAKRAGALVHEESLGGWLYRAAVLEARQAIRTEVRRLNRQTTAAELGTTMKEDETTLAQHLSEALDEALLALPEPDRRTLLWRFFEDRSHREIGQMAGTGEDAARKRVDKALTRLEAELQRRGYPAATAAAAAAALTSAGAMTAPPALAGACTQAAVLAAAGTTGVLGALLARILGMSRVQTAGACLLAASIPLGWQWKEVRDARAEYNQLRTQEAAAARQLESAAESGRLAREQSKQRRQSLAALQQEAVRLEQYAENIRTNSYAWPAEGDYIRVPKSLISSLGLYSDGGRPRFAGRKPLESTAVLSPLGEPSAILQQVLGMSEWETKSFQAIYAGAADQIGEREAGNQIASDGHPRSYNVGYPHSRTLATEPFPEEGRAVLNGMAASMTDLLGAERAQALHGQIDAELDSRLHGFGQWRHFASVFWDDAGHVSIGQDDMDPGTGNFRGASITGIAAFSQIDPVLQALLPENIQIKARALEAATAAASAGGTPLKP